MTDTSKDGGVANGNDSVCDTNGGGEAGAILLEISWNMHS